MLLQYGQKSNQVYELNYMLKYISVTHGRSDFDPGIPTEDYTAMTSQAVASFARAVGMGYGTNGNTVDDNLFAAVQAVYSAEPGSVSFYTSPSTGNTIITGTPSGQSGSGIGDFFGSLADAFKNIFIPGVTAKPVAKPLVLPKATPSVDWTTIGIFAAIGLGVFMLMDTGKPARKRR